MKNLILQKSLALLLAMLLATSSVPMGAMASDGDEGISSYPVTTEAEPTESTAVQEEAPTEEAPTEEAPTEEVLAEEAPAEEAPAEEAELLDSEDAPEQPQNDVAMVDGTGYADLETAIEAAVDGQTVMLQADVTLTEVLPITKSVHVNLGGNTVVGGQTGAFHVQSGTLTLSGSGSVVGTGNDAAIRVGDDTASGTAGLVIESGVTVSAPAGKGVGVYGSGTTETVTVRGTISAAQAAISGSGSSGHGGTAIRIEGGAEVVSTGSAAIYHPQSGSLTVSGGTVRGVTAIEAKAGTVDISGDPVVEATGAVGHSPDDDGPSTTGYSLAAVENGRNAGNPVFTVSGGSFRGGVGKLTDSANAAGDGSITASGGRYTADVSGFLASGKVCLSGEGDYPYTIGTEIAQVWLTVNEPAVDAVPPDYAILPADAGYTAGKVTWARRTGENQGVYMADGEEFAAGNDYRCTVTLTAKAGFGFAGTVTAPTGWTPVRNSDGTVTLTSKTFRLASAPTDPPASPTPVQITKIANGTVPRVPESGEKPQTPSQITAGDGYQVSSVTWKDKKGNTLFEGRAFAAHTVYTAIVKLAAGENRVFADKQTLKNGLPNGWSVDSVTDDGKTAVVFKTFAETGHIDADRDNDCDSCGELVNSIPYTGDVSQVGLWTAAMLVSAGCLAGLGFAAYKKRKTKSKELE